MKSPTNLNISNAHVFARMILNSLRILALLSTTLADVPYLTKEMKHILKFYLEGKPWDSDGIVTYDWGIDKMLDKLKQK